MKGNLEHPYSVDGKYYAKIDGELHEISEEVFREMHNSYRRSLEKKVETKNEKMKAIQDAYWIAKKNNQKYAPKKFQ